MKQGKSLISLVMLVLAAALAVYLGIYVLNTFEDPFATTLAYYYTANDSVKADGLLVREELLLSGQQGIWDITRSEGERVGVGAAVALIYRDNQAQAVQAELDELDLELELLEYAVSDTGGVGSAARLDQDIFQAVVALRASSALGDYVQLEDQVMEVKSGVLKRGYIYGDTLAVTDLSAQLRELKSRRTALSQRAASAITRVTAPQAGTFSNLVDGYETLLTPEGLSQLTPSSLASLMSSPPSPPAALGKLILGARWYFAAALPSQSAGRLKEGGTALLRFSGDFSQDVTMQVDRIGPSEGEQTLVIFSSDRYLAQTTLLRRQTAELIFQDYTGLRIPKQALRLEKRTKEDPETGLSTETSLLGVYVLAGGRAEFKEVSVVLEGSDYYVVTSAVTGRKALRAGDEVITQGTGLYDGQLLEF